MQEPIFADTDPQPIDMALPCRRPHFKMGIAHLIIFFVLLQLIIAFCTYQQSLTFDEAIWQYIGRNWFRNGLTPYLGGVDNKSPLIFAIFGFSDKLFGVNFWFPRLLGICFQSAGIYFVYKIANHFSGKQAGTVAVTIYGLSLLWHATGGKYVSYTESYSVTCIIAAYYYAAAAKGNNNLFLSGFLAGLGCAFRITGFFGVLAIFITLILNKKKFPFFFSSGVLTSITFFIVLFSSSGISLSDLYLNLFADNFSSGGMADHPVAWRLDSFINHFFFSELVLFLPALVGYFFMKKTNTALLIWLICEFTGISIIGLYSNQHFKNLLPALSLINAFVIINFIETYKISYKKLLIIVWISFFPKLLEPLVSIKKVFFPLSESRNTGNNNSINREPDENSKKMLGLWVKSNTSAHDEVLVAGYGAVVQAYSERISPGIYFNVTETAIAKKKFFEELTHTKPAMILVPGSLEYISGVSADLQKFTEQIVSQSYYLEGRLYGYDVYRQNQSGFK